jgi:hypothetical protein
MMKDEHPKPPIAGVIYGRIAYSVVMLGILIAIVGMVMYFVSDGYIEQDCLLDSLWDGEKAEAIWEGNCTAGDHSTGDAGTEGDSAEPAIKPNGHFYLSMLSYGDGIAMLGIAICCFAAVAGMWGAFIGTIRSGERIYVLFALIIAVILTLSAIGIIQLE